MKTAGRRFKFVNSTTGYSIYYYSVKHDMDDAQIKIELEKIRAQVATQYGILINNVYWQQVRDDE